MRHSLSTYDGKPTSSNLLRYLPFLSYGTCAHTPTRKGLPKSVGVGGVAPAPRTPPSLGVRPSPVLPFPHSSAPQERNKRKAGNVPSTVCRNAGEKPLGFERMEAEGDQSRVPAGVPFGIPSVQTRTVRTADRVPAAAVRHSTCGQKCRAPVSRTSRRDRARGRAREEPTRVLSRRARRAAAAVSCAWQTLWPLPEGLP